jgi:hypothetical protein
VKPFPPSLFVASREQISKMGTGAFVFYRKRKEET